MIRPLLVTALLLLLVSSPAAAGNFDPSLQAPVRDAVARVAPCVVQIETVGGAAEIGGLAVPTGPTTGLVIDREGYVLSSSINFAHAPSGILVRLSGGQRRAARLVATDHQLKVSLLKLEGNEPAAAASLALSEKPRVGQWAIAVGKAFDVEQPNVAVGIISAVQRVWGKAVQTDAAVSPNNYGGPLIDLKGNVLGLLVPMSPMSDDEVAGVEWYDSGIGFAVSSDRLLTAVSRLRSGKDLRAGLLGVVFEKSVAMSGPAVVRAVHPNGPAEKAGLKKGDRIVRVGDRTVARASELKYELAARYAGDPFDMLVRRGEETLECKATLADHLEPYRCPVLGILPERKSGKMPGVAVRASVPDSPAAKGGIVAGDRIVSLDGQAMADSGELRSRLSRRKAGETVTLEIVRENDRRKLEAVLAPSATTLPDNLPVRSLDPEATAGQTVSLALPQWKNKIEAYLPKAYSEKVPHGLLVWLRSPTDKPSDLEHWQEHADGRGVIVVLVEPSDNRRWLPSEQELVRDVLRLCRSRFSLAPRRIVVGGRAGGGTLAYRTATREREELSGCVTFDARLAGSPILDAPENRFGLLIGHAEKGRLVKYSAQVAESLRKGGLPVIVVSYPGQSGALTGHDYAAILRWLDLLDQI